MLSLARRHTTAVTIINLKGGVGRTRTAWFLPGIRQERGKRLLVVDADTQTSIGQSLLASEDPPILGVEAFFDPRTDADPMALIQTTRSSHIDLPPSSSALAAYDLSGRRRRGPSDFHLSLADALPGLQDR